MPITRDEDADYDAVGVFRDEIREELREELRDELRDEIRDELRAELRAKNLNELTKELEGLPRTEILDSSGIPISHNNEGGEYGALMENEDQEEASLLYGFVDKRPPSAPIADLDVSVEAAAVGEVKVDAEVIRAKIVNKASVSTVSLVKARTVLNRLRGSDETDPAKGNLEPVPITGDVLETLRSVIDGAILLSSAPKHDNRILAALEQLQRYLEEFKSTFENTEEATQSFTKLLKTLGSAALQLNGLIQLLRQLLG